jgi:hypothetical protein
MNVTRGNMMHVERMDRDFTVDVSRDISLSECVVHHIFGPVLSFAVVKAGEMNGKQSHTAQSQTACNQSTITSYILPLLQ